MTASSKNMEGAASAAPSLAQLAEEIRGEIQAAEEGHRSALQHAIRAGELLTKAKGRMGHGEWLPWLEKNFELTRRMATNYMRLAANGKRISHLGSVNEALAAVREISGEASEPSRPRKRPPNATPAEATTRLRSRVREVQAKDARVRPRWTLEDVADVKAIVAGKQGANPTGKRLKDIGAKRAQARRVGKPPSPFWEIAHQISKLAGLLYSLDLESVDLDEQTLDDIDAVHDDLLFLQEWMDRTMMSIQRRLGEQTIREKIVKLRAKTVQAGCSPEEAQAARRAAERLERKLAAQLSA